MFKKKWPKEVKDEVKKSRVAGMTYRELMNKFMVPKSTLNSWFSDLPKSDHISFTDPVGWMKIIRPMSSFAIKEKRTREVTKIADEAKREVSGWMFLHNDELKKSILTMLYWAEGAKLPERGASVRFANTDPRMILLFLTLLRQCYDLDESKVRIRIYVHWYHDIELTKKFWSELLNVDYARFSKTHVKPRSKNKRFRKNFAGICFVSYYNVDLRWKIQFTAYNIAEQILGRSLDDLKEVNLFKRS